MSKKRTQGRALISALKRKAHTYLEMQMLGISTSPQKRVIESLRPDERVEKVTRRGLVAWRVVAQ